jgi:hypothetical protein
VRDVRNECDLQLFSKTISYIWTIRKNSQGNCIRRHRSAPVVEGDQQQGLVWGRMSSRTVMTLPWVVTTPQAQIMFQPGKCTWKKTEKIREM